MGRPLCDEKRATTAGARRKRAIGVTMRWSVRDCLPTTSWRRWWWSARLYARAHKPLTKPQSHQPLEARHGAAEESGGPDTAPRDAGDERTACRRHPNWRCGLICGEARVDAQAAQPRRITAADVVETQCISSMVELVRASSSAIFAFDGEGNGFQVGHPYQ